MDIIPVQLPLCSLDTKVCRVCEALLPIDQFSIHTRATGQRRTDCKACDAASSAAYRAEHPEHNKLYKAANPERHRARFAAWREVNIDRHKATRAAWGRANPGRLKANWVRHNRHIELNGGTYTGAEWKALKAYHEYRCLWCKRQEPAIKLTADHVVPVSKGGTNDIGNIQPLCQPCNTRKKDRYMDFR